MRNVARGLAGIVALIYAASGLRFMFTPAAAALHSGLEASGLAGTANLRALLGGTFIAFAILLGAHTAAKGEDFALRFAILHLLVTLVGRAISAGIDGVDALALRNFAPATLMLVVSVVSLVLLKKSESTAEVAELERGPRHAHG